MASVASAAFPASDLIVSSAVSAAPQWQPPRSGMLVDLFIKVFKYIRRGRHRRSQSCALAPVGGVGAEADEMREANRDLVAIVRRTD